MAKEEMNEAKASIPEMEDQLKILLLPKDENDDKNVVVEIRGGAGGDEAALFAAELIQNVLYVCRNPEVEDRNDIRERKRTWRI